MSRFIAFYNFILPPDHIRFAEFPFVSALVSIHFGRNNVFRD